MADKHNDTVIINLDKPYEVKFTHVAIKRFSSIHEMPVNQIPAALGRYDLATDIIFLCLNAENPTMSRDDLDKLIETEFTYGRMQLSDIINIAADAVTKAFGIDEETDSNNAAEDAENPKKAAGTGK